MRFLLLVALAGAAAASNLDWWRTALVYQIYPRSFKDSDGDGIGDLNGITSKLGYLHDTGVDAIWLSPIYKSPILRAEPYRQRERMVPKVVQARGRIRRLLRISIFRKSAWEYNEERQQFYLHQFVIGQPDLNYREPKGVSGFRVDAINMMYEVDPNQFGGRYPDEPLSNTYNVVYDWRDVLDEYILKDGDFLGDIKNTSTAQDMKANGNHDQSRVANRQGTDRIDAMNLLALILPGETVDPQACNTDDPINYAKSSRDPNRTPYHWDASKNAGFSDTDGKTWLPIASNYKTVNLANEMANSRSHYHFYKDVVALKKTDTEESMYNIAQQLRLVQR
ncbi:hypothetical protein MSG28_007739 [Choristoneura fumiferana]|uniref:Uncharacterized protein n=1 Tax=Choristoneura fumiferana TaxID=7141 RepID=A0ACC0JYN6_CHOFU|nr:hypothetical protein MSG28_007739 [Choristoneura fumiferana]